MNVEIVYLHPVLLSQIFWQGRVEVQNQAASRDGEHDSWPPSLYVKSKLSKNRCLILDFNMTMSKQLLGLSWALFQWKKKKCIKKYPSGWANRQKKAEKRQQNNRKRRKTHKNVVKRRKHKKSQKNVEKRGKKQKNIEKRRNAPKSISDGTLGAPWARFGRSWALLGRSWALLGRSWKPLGRLLHVSCEKA